MSLSVLLLSAGACTSGRSVSAQRAVACETDGSFTSMPMHWRQGGVGRVVPSAFRAALARLAPQYDGKTQEDAHQVRPVSAEATAALELPGYYAGAGCKVAVALHGELVAEQNRDA